MKNELNPKEYAVRIGLFTAAMLANFADTINGVYPDIRKTQWLGGLTDHVGDNVWGMTAIVLGFGTWKILEESGVNRDVSRILGLAIIAGAFSFVIWAEMTGFGNKSDLLDLPAIGLGMLGTASACEMWFKDSRNALSGDENN